MVNTIKLKTRMTEKEKSQTVIAAAIGIAQSTFNQKINNVRPMNLDEAERIQHELEIPDAEFCSYFFCG